MLRLPYSDLSYFFLPCPFSYAYSVDENMNSKGYFRFLIEKGERKGDRGSKGAKRASNAHGIVTLSPHTRREMHATGEETEEHVSACEPFAFVSYW